MRPMNTSLEWGMQFSRPALKKMLITSVSWSNSFVHDHITGGDQKIANQMDISKRGNSPEKEFSCFRISFVIVFTLTV